MTTDAKIKLPWEQGNDNDGESFAERFTTAVSAFAKGVLLADMAENQGAPEEVVGTLLMVAGAAYSEMIETLAERKPGGQDPLAAATEGQVWRAVTPIEQFDAVAEYVAELIYTGMTDAAIAAQMRDESSYPEDFDTRGARRFVALVREEIAP